MSWRRGAVRIKTVLWNSRGYNGNPLYEYARGALRAREIQERQVEGEMAS